MELKPIKIQKNIFKIPINDNEFIEINLNDHNFLKNLQELKNVAINEYPKFESGNTDKDFEKLNVYCEKTSNLINKIFGNGTVKKVFGVELPTIDILVDFIEQITPHLEKAMEQIQDKFEKKYNTYEKRAETRENSK